MCIYTIHQSLLHGKCKVIFHSFDLVTRQTNVSRNDNVHEFSFSKCQPPFIWSSVGSVCDTQQSPTRFFPSLLQIIPQQLCFFLGVRKRKKAWERKTRLSRHRNLFKTQVNDCFSSFSQSSAPFKSLQSHIYIECQINEQLISRALDIKVPEEDVGPKECDCLINNIRSFLI